MPYSKKDVGSYQLPDPLVDAYRKKGLNALYDWQAECLHCDTEVLYIFCDMSNFVKFEFFRYDENLKCSKQKNEIEVGQ